MPVVTVGLTPRQGDVFRSTTRFVGEAVGEDSIWSILHRECHVLFPDDAFADLFQTTGRQSIPPRIVVVVMVLQKAFGLSDREATAAFQRARGQVNTHRMGRRSLNSEEKPPRNTGGHTLTAHQSDRPGLQPAPNPQTGLTQPLSQPPHHTNQPPEPPQRTPAS